MKKIDKPWGYELIWAHTDAYVGKILHVEAGKRLSLQYHREKDETILIKTGRLLLESGPSQEDLSELEMNPGDSFHIKPGVVHRMTAVTDVDVVEVSTTQLDDVVRIQDDFGR